MNKVGVRMVNKSRKNPSVSGLMCVSEIFICRSFITRKFYSKVSKVLSTCIICEDAKCNKSSFKWSRFFFKNTTKFDNVDGIYCLATLLLIKSLSVHIKYTCHIYRLCPYMFSHVLSSLKLHVLLLRTNNSFSVYSILVV